MFCIPRNSSNIHLANELNTCECFPVPPEPVWKTKIISYIFYIFHILYIRYYQQNVLRSHSSIWLCTVDKNKKLAEFPHCVQTNYQLFAMLACIYVLCIYATIKAGRSLTLSRTFSPVAGTEQKRIVSFRRKLLYVFLFFSMWYFPTAHFWCMYVYNEEYGFGTRKRNSTFLYLTCMRVFLTFIIAPSTLECIAYCRKYFRHIFTVQMCIYVCCVSDAGGACNTFSSSLIFTN